MRLFERTHIFENDWNTITAAFWVKYPNPLQPHVLRVDTVDFTVNDKDQSFRLVRIMSLRYNTPRWVQKFFGPSPIGFGVEDAFCSFKEKRLILKSCNYTFSSFFRVEEECEYIPSPTNSQHTMYRQSARYRVSGLGFPVNNAIENAAVKQAEEKSKLGVSAMESIGMKLKNQNWFSRSLSCWNSIEAAAHRASVSWHELLKSVEGTFRISNYESRFKLFAFKEHIKMDNALQRSLFMACSISTSLDQLRRVPEICKNSMSCDLDSIFHDIENSKISDDDSTLCPCLQVTPQGTPPHNLGS